MMKNVIALTGFLVMGGIIHGDDLKLNIKASGDQPTQEMTCKNGDYEVCMYVTPQEGSERVRITGDVKRNDTLVCKPEMEMDWNDCATLCMQEEKGPFNMVMTLEKGDEPCLDMEIVKS